MRGRSNLWAKLAARGRFRTEAKLVSGGKDYTTISAPIIVRKLMAQPMAVRNHMAADAALRTLLPLLAAIPLFAVLIWYLVGRGLRPLERLARDVASRRPDALQPLLAERVPDLAVTAAVLPEPKGALAPVETGGDPALQAEIEVI